MKIVRLWIRRVIMACFGRTQRVTALPRPTRARRSRVAGPALAAFDSEMLAAENGEIWGPDMHQGQGLVPVGGGVSSEETHRAESPSTPVPPAPCIPPLPRIVRVMSTGGDGPPTSRMVVRLAH